MQVGSVGIAWKPITYPINCQDHALSAVIRACIQITWLTISLQSKVIFLCGHCDMQAIQCLGGNGYVNEYPTGRLLRDAKLFEIGAGTSEIRRMIIGRELFKQD